MTTKPPGWLKRWWHRTVPEPRYASTVYATIYTVFVLTGIATLTTPPQTLAGMLGQAGMGLVGWFFLIGGVVGMGAGWREWWELERWAIVLMLVGLTAYGYIVVSLHFQTTGSRLTQLGIILIATCALILRIGMIWRYPYKPRG